ncbi:MAG: hypothetical protein JRI23_12535 [Deltaproteobacteria bacterium]|jgi:hypothetical protein|nr:hypothetical protein [Deltaproteobacteria bacterium]MBW2532543.1 hypothetical protein [Deltaproteobacteria bacterium]
MRKLTLWFGALSALVGVMSVEACSDDVETNEPTPTTTAAGGGGSGGGTTTTTTGTGGTGGSANPCSGVTGACEQACCKIENECDFGMTVTCDMLNSFISVLDCDAGGDTADCNGQCVLDVECSVLLTLLSQDWDPDLSACLLGCNSGDCMACAAQSDNCQTEFTNCATDQTGVCGSFMQCLSGQSPGTGGGGTGGAGEGGAAPCEDPDCLADCQSQYNNQAVNELVTCTCAECAGECPQCGAGGGGQGGQGGS